MCESALVSRPKRFGVLGVVALALVGLSLMRVRTLPATPVPPRVEAQDFAEYSSAPLDKPLGLLFMHHAVGANLLADPGVGDGQHREGGGARRLLQENGYLVHSATFGSTYGAHNFIFDWAPKFANHMNELLHIEEQDRMLKEPNRNRVVMFKSSFDNSRFVGKGDEPGVPSGPELTLANAKAAFRVLPSVFGLYPDTLFVFVTTPPLALPKPERLARVAGKWLLGRPSADQEYHAAALLAREFHDWIVSPDGWLRAVEAKNIVVFDLYDILTRRSTSVFLEYPTGDGTDSHPSREANQRVAKLLVPFLNRAVRRAQLVDLPRETASPAPGKGGLVDMTGPIP